MPRAPTGATRECNGVCVNDADCVSHAVIRDCFYTSFCNFLNYTASVFPVTFADMTLDGRAPPHQFHNKEDEAVYKLCKWYRTLQSDR